MRKKILLAGVLSMASVVAQAADNGIYVGLGLGNAKVEEKDVLDDFDFDQDGLGYKVFIGVRPLDWLGFEADYVNFGDKDEDYSFDVAGETFDFNLKLEGYGIAGYAVGFIPIGPVDIFGKVGLVSWDTKAKSDGVAGLPETAFNWQRDSGEDLAYGVGVQFRLLSLGLRAEYEIFDIDGLDDANFLSVGVSYTFL
jgi:opacity protein-like surface antigen